MSDTKRGIRWPLGLKRIGDLPMPIKLMTREELRNLYPKRAE